PLDSALLHLHTLRPPPPPPLFPYTTLFRSPATGTYLIEVTSRSAGETGPYELTLGSPTSPYAVGGRVTAADGVTGLGGVTVTFARVSGAGALPVPVPTNAAGFWSQSGFEPGTEYRVTLRSEEAISQ